MITTCIQGQLVSPPPADGLPEFAAVAGEIGARLLELEELKVGSSADLLYRLSELFRLDPAAYRYACVLLSGEIRPLTEPFADQAARRALTKQAVEEELAAALRRIRQAFPELWTLILDSRERAYCHDCAVLPATIDPQGRDWTRL